MLRPFNGERTFFFFPLFFLFLPAPVACRTISSSTRDLTHALCSEINEVGPLLSAMYKNLLKTNGRPKHKTCVCSVTSVVSDSFQPYGLQPARLLVHGILQAKTLEWIAMLSLSRSSETRDCTQGLPHLLHHRRSLCC